MRYLYNLVVDPEGRLPSAFPWTIQEAGRRYLVATFYFILGSIAVPAILAGGLFFLAYYPVLLSEMTDPNGLARSFSVVGLFGGLIGLTWYAVRWFRRGRPGGWGPLFGVPVHFGLGAVLLSLAYFFLLPALQPVYPDVIECLRRWMMDEKMQPSQSFVMTFTALSFLAGFGLEIWYISYSLRQIGSSFRQAMALHFDGIKGSWWGQTAWRVVLAVALAYGVALALCYPIVALMGVPHQPTVDLARSLSGGNFLLFALMAAVGAPIVEEIAFRGFLFQMLRSGLKREPGPFVPRQLPASGWLVGPRRLLAMGANLYRCAVHWIAAGFVRTFGGSLADFSAVVLSALVFSVMHLQFHPTTLVLLFVLGVIHAELYRRTGSLYCSILLHALNNGLDVWQLWLEK